MTRSRLILGVAAVLAGATVLFVVLGVVFNPVLVLAAAPFGVAAYFLWSDATGRFEGRVRWRAVDDWRAPRDRSWATRGGDGYGFPDGPGPSMDREEALATLGLKRGATQPAIRRAYRNRVKAVHPDAEAGDEDAFRRVRAAYERLAE